MDDIYYERILNRIIQGRLRLKLGDLVLFIYEPSADILEESFDIYEEAYEKAYFDGVYIDREIKEVLVNNNLWTPFDDREADEIQDQIEDHKVAAFKAFFRPKELKTIKASIRRMERDIVKLRQKKVQFDHLTCAGVANFARKSWILSKTTKNLDGSDFHFIKCSISSMLEFYSDKEITPGDFRKVARIDSWRSMWNSSKKRADVFDKPSCFLDKNQLSLVSYSQMYDNVYESTDRPADKIIEDDDCLDGWFVLQKRKYEEDRKQKESEDLLSNEKIANSQEIYIMSRSDEETKNIYDMNSIGTKRIIQERKEFLNAQTEKDIHFKHLPDVEQERAINATNAGIQSLKGR